MPITLKKQRELTDKLNSELKTLGLPNNLTFTPLVDLKVICPEAKGCEFTGCMHHEKHSPVSFQHGTWHLLHNAVNVSRPYHEM